MQRILFSIGLLSLSDYLLDVFLEFCRVLLHETIRQDTLKKRLLITTLVFY